ncbi:hypothetical protein EC968_008719 [Mortierella alpina]|nr:hypothetical protein EC968_008719 [Mortierella alpina]
MSSSSDRSSFKDTPSSPKLSRPLSPASRVSVEQGDETLLANGLVSPSARSSFLKALGKFKSKHLQQKRSSAPPPAIDTLDAPPPLAADRRASYIIPPITFDDNEAHPVQDAAITLTLPVEHTETAETVRDELVPSAPSGTSSLRIKFKNKVNNKLASMRSSSNLREGMKDLSDSQRQSNKSNDLKVVSTADDMSNRHSKIAWSIPRIRPESRQGSRPQTPWSAETSATKEASEQTPSTKPSIMDSTSPRVNTHDSTTLDQQLQALKVDELDSDHSLDIILPADYEDYTQFAELPLKKRKKMERALAANLSADTTGSEKRPMSMRASADAVKRFLSQQRQEANKGRQMNNKNEDKDARDSITVVAREMNPATVNSNKKRPQPSTECTDPASSGKKAGHQAADWRRSLMRSLHLGKGNASARTTSSQLPNNLNRSSAVSPLGTECDQSASNQQSSPEAGQLGRSGSVRTVRALSLTTSSHPALLATTVSKPRGQGLRRETLEMAMRRRRQSSVVTARSNISNSDIPPVPARPAEFFETDNASTTNITHTFTSFTLEFADMHHAHEVMNNSAIPGLFNFKARKPRLTVSSNIMMELDTDQEFRGFDSDGDAISGYTGDADVSMDDIQIHSPKLSSAARSGAEHPKARTRVPSSAADASARRKMSSVDGDSDTITELPTLTIRTRDLNRSNSGGRGANSGSGNNGRMSRPVSGSSFEVDQRSEIERENPRSPRRAGAVSPSTTPRNGRSVLSINTDTKHVPSSPTKASTRARMSMEEVVSWEPRDMYSHSTRPAIPMLDTKPLKPTRGTAMPSSTALSSSSRSPHASFMTQSPSVMTPAPGTDNRGSSSRHHHQQSSSTSSMQYPSHQHQMSGDTLVPSHYKNFSSGSTMSASSGYSAQTLPGGRPQHYQYPSFSGIETGPPGAQEYNPNEEFSPTTPADLKAMDFEALLATAEREHQKEWEEMKIHKQMEVTSGTSSMGSSSMVQQHPRQQQQPNVAPLKIANSASKAQRSAQQQQPQQQPQRNTVAFDLGPSDDGGTGTGTGTGTGSDRSVRSKRVMKKKMSVIRLTGNGSIQGRREDDGVIRVSMSPSPGTGAAVVGGRDSTTQTQLYSQNQWRQ